MIPFPNISPIAFSIARFQIHWYGIAYILSVFLGLKLCHYYANKYNPTLSKIEDVSSYLVLGIIIGGRLGHILFYDLSYYLLFPSKIIKIWEGGMAFHGGLIGAIIGVWLFSHKTKQPFLSITDLLSTSAPLGGFFIRGANFINGELYGRPTSLPWGMIFPHSDGLVRHPSQLYEMFFEGIVLFFITNIAYKKHYLKKGYITGIAIFFYGLFRFMIEFVRDPSDGYWWIFTKGQVLCIPMLILGLIFMLKNSKKFDFLT